MILSANGKNFTVPGKNIKVSLSMELKQKDLSGQTSSTASTSAGKKSKKLGVALTLPELESKQLEELLNVATAEDKDGNPVIYSIVDEKANAANIRMVIFDGSLKVKDAGNLRAWDISFTLSEKYSVAEKKEQRQPAKQAAATSEKGKSVAKGGGLKQVQKALKNNESSGSTVDPSGDK